MKDFASNFETLRRALSKIPNRTLVILCIVLVIIAILSSLMLFHKTGKRSAEPFRITVLSRPRSETAALQAAGQRASKAQHCVEIAVETARTLQPLAGGVHEIPLHKLLCTASNGSVSVLALATFSTKRHAFSVIGSGRLAEYDAAALFRTIESAAHGARPTPAPTGRIRASKSSPAAPAKLKSYSANGMTMTIENLSTDDCPGGVKAESDKKAALLMIVNQSSRSLDVDQVDANGDRARYATIPPTLSISIPTYASQPWVLSENSSCLTVVIAHAGTGRIMLR